MPVLNRPRLPSLLPVLWINIMMTLLLLVFKVAVAQSSGSLLIRSVIFESVIDLINIIVSLTAVLGEEMHDRPCRGSPLEKLADFGLYSGMCLTMIWIGVQSIKRVVGDLNYFFFENTQEPSRVIISLSSIVIMSGIIIVKLVSYLLLYKNAYRRIFQQYYLIDTVINLAAFGFGFVASMGSTGKWDAGLLMFDSCGAVFISIYTICLSLKQVREQIHCLCNYSVNITTIDAVKQQAHNELHRILSQAEYSNVEAHLGTTAVYRSGSGYIIIEQSILFVNNEIPIRQCKAICAQVKLCLKEMKILELDVERVIIHATD